MNLSLNSLRRAALAMLCAVPLLAAAVSFVPPAFAQTGSETVLLLGHSKSMLSRMGGEAKIKGLHGVLEPMLAAQAGKLEMGVVSFGAEKARACETHNVVKSIGAIDPAADFKAIEKETPKGSGALSAGMTAAAKLFKTTSGARSMIVVTDSLDECKADPCAIAADLKKEAPTTIIHLIALGEKSDEKLAELACVPEQTGGVFIAAQTEDELNEALEKTLRLAALGASEDEQGLPVPVIAPPSATDRPISKDPGSISLAAILAKDTQPLSSGLVWRVYDGRVRDDGSYKLIQTYRDARPDLTLPGGDYLINAAYGRANVTKRVTIWPDKRADDVFNLNAGGLRLYATLAKQPLFSEHALTFDVYSEETDQFGNRRKVVPSAKSGVVLRLNSGTYRVESTYGDSNAVIEADVTVEPGKLTEATIDHQAGKVTFRLVQKPGGEAMADTIWQIFADDGQLVKRSGGAFPSHVLAAGSYVVRVEHGGREFAAKFAVDAGDKKQVEVVMP